MNNDSHHHHNRYINIMRGPFRRSKKITYEMQSLQKGGNKLSNIYTK
jgi:hypothetical protein